MIDALARAMDASGAQVVHVIGAGARLAGLVERTTCLPWLLTVHCLPPMERAGPLALLDRGAWYDRARRAMTLASRLAWGRVLARGSFDRVICHGEGVAGLAEAAGGAPDRIVLVALWCDWPTFLADGQSPFPREAYPKLLTVAGFAPSKGQHDALDAASLLAREFPRMHHAFVGDAREPAYLDHLRRRAARLGVGSLVSFHADASEGVRAAALTHADAYVQPSHEEGFCLSFMEAAMLCPRLVGTRTGAMASVAEGDRDCVIVEPKDAAALASATRALLASTISGRSMARRRARLRARWSWRAHAEAHARLYRDAVARARAAREDPIEAGITPALAPAAP